MNGQLSERPARKKPAPRPARLTPDQRLVVPLEGTDDLFDRIRTVVHTLQGETP